MTRAQCRAEVFARAHSHCQRCGRYVSDRFPEWHSQRAAVNETVPRSRGGDPTDPNNCELLCRDCHMPGGRHAPTPERMQALRRPKEEGL